MGAFIHENRYVLLILAIFAYTVIYLYRFQRKQAFDREFQYLLQKGTPEECRKHLQSPAGKKIYHEYELKIRELDSDLHFDRRKEARELIQELLSTPMKERDFIAFHNKALNFAVQEKDPEIAEQVCSAFSKYKRHAKYATEARQVTDIYLYRKADYIDKLTASSQKTGKPSVKATAYYRIARQYYYLKDMENCRRYLEMAYTVFPDKTWRKLIDELLKGDYAQFA